MEEELRTLMLADTDITALTSTRITWGERSQGSTVPAVNMTIISGPDSYHMGGASAYREYRVQVDCYGVTYGAAKTTARAVQALLSGHSGAQFQGVFLVGERDLRSAGSNDAESLFSVSQDYQIHHS